MFGEMRKEEEMLENELNPKLAINRELRDIERELGALFVNKQLNEVDQFFFYKIKFNLYLYGIVLKELQRTKEARAIFVKVLEIFPCFWSCWLELCKISQDEDGVMH
jgi:anaphase-promoting complex subunit 8